MRWWHGILGLSFAMVAQAVAEAHGGGSSGGGFGDWLDELLLVGVVVAALLLIGVITAISRTDRKIDHKEDL